MLNFGSKPSQDVSLRKIAIWGANLVLNGSPKFGPPSWGVKGVYPSMWEVKVGSGLRATESYKIPFHIVWSYGFRNQMLC